MTLPLLDRQAELGALAHAIGDAGAGEGRLVLVGGGAGAGKSSLLAAGRVLGARAGLRVLFARGGELEREHPYGIVRQLFEPVLVGDDAAGWLDGPGAAAASVFGAGSTLDTAAFATLNGLYWLTVNAAGRGPLALVVDDLHWADRPSLHFVQYLAARLDGLPVLLVLGGRPAESDVLADLAARPGAVPVRPGPLSRDAATRLTRELLGVAPTTRFAAACWAATAGNPLLLVELLRALRAEGVAPDDANLAAIDHVGPSALAQIVLTRLRRLPPVALAVAQTVAVLGTGAEATLVAELAELDGREVAEAVRLLIDAEIVDAQPPLGFVHPIVRDAVYRELSPDERDRRHARAAELLRDRAAEPGQVGAHLLRAQPRGERWIVEALRAAADDAGHRGASESAVTFLRRALAERPADAGFDLLLALAMAEAAIDPHAAVEHLGAALRLAPDADRRGRAGELLTRIQVFTDPPAAIAAARATRSELPADDGRQPALLAMERFAGRFSGIRASWGPDPAPRTARGRMLTAVEAWDRMLSGDPAPVCVALAADALGLDEASGGHDVRARTPLFTAMIAGTVLLLADDPRAQGFWDEWHAEATRAGRAHAVIAGNVWQGALLRRLGRFADAEAALREALEGPRRWGPGTGAIPATTLAVFAEILIERGDLPGARSALDRALRQENPATEGALMCRRVELDLLLAEGRHADVLDAADAVGDRLATVRNPVWGPWRSSRAEALAGVGRLDEAIELVAEELELARAWGTPGPVGRALSLLGALTGDVHHLEEAVEVTRDEFARLEHAKALLALGSALRRGRRPSDARAFLRDAHELALRCGTARVAKRARDELAAAGGRPRAVADGGTASLTPSERRVAELAAAGHRNREIAQQLYLSPKTVEVHLTNTYRKLGIRTRGELGPALDPPAQSERANPTTSRTAPA